MKPESTERTAARGDREEGKRRGRRLSSQNQAESGRKEAEAREKPGREADARKRKRREAPVLAAVGAKPGRMKGNEQEAEYENRKRRHGKPGREERGKPKKRERERSTD